MDERGLARVAADELQVVALRGDAQCESPYGPSSTLTMCRSDPLTTRSMAWFGRARPHHAGTSEIETVTQALAGTNVVRANPPHPASSEFLGSTSPSSLACAPNSLLSKQVLWLAWLSTWLSNAPNGRYKLERTFGN